jgi:hypothetical protein
MNGLLVDDPLWPACSSAYPDHQLVTDLVDRISAALAGAHRFGHAQFLRAGRAGGRCCR